MRGLLAKGGGYTHPTSYSIPLKNGIQLPNSSLISPCKGEKINILILVFMICLEFGFWNLEFI
jgi:hypothetical protein